MKNLSAILFVLLLGFSLSGEILASSAKSVVETQVEGEAEVYQSVETTVNGETIKKESTQPGKLELKMEKTGEGEPTVTFSQETTSPSPTLILETEKSSQSLITRLINFLKKLFSRGVKRTLFWFTP